MPITPSTPWLTRPAHRQWLRDRAEELFSWFEPRAINPKGGFFELDDEGVTPQSLKRALELFDGLFAGHAQAAEPESCRQVRMADPGWTDITATNGVASVVLEALGYQPDVKTLSVPIGYQSMKNGEIDVFLGNWMPAQQAFIDRSGLSITGSVVEGDTAGRAMSRCPGRDLNPGSPLRTVS